MILPEYHHLHDAFFISALPFNLMDLWEKRYDRDLGV